MRFSGRFKGYNLQKFQKDLIAGIVVGVVAIPLGMAFAIASGVGRIRAVHCCYSRDLYFFVWGIKISDWRSDGRLCPDFIRHYHAVRLGKSADCGVYGRGNAGAVWAV